jgi:hypothetical protein
MTDDQLKQTDKHGARYYLNFVRIIYTAITHRHTTEEMLQGLDKLKK